jgi:hypothetical protein
VTSSFSTLDIPAVDLFRPTKYFASWWWDIATLCVMSDTMIPTATERIDYIEGGRVWAYIVPADSCDEFSFSGTIYRVTGWSDDGQPIMCGDCVEEVGPIYLKWDGCCHIGVRDPGLDNHWTHVCGAADFRRTLNILEWAWKEARKRIARYDSKSGGEL